MTLTCIMIHGDCLEELPRCGISEGRLAVADLPYGTTGHDWDQIGDNKRIITALECVLATDARMAIFLPAVSMVSMGAVGTFRMVQDLVLCKARSSSIFSAKKQPMKYHENVFITERGSPVFNPIKHPRSTSAISSKSGSYKLNARSNLFNMQHSMDCTWGTESYAGSLIIPTKPDEGRGTHPTIKPSSAIAQLIQWYTQPGELIVDPVCGSATSAVAALSCGRSAVCIERDDKYFAAGVERIRKYAVDNKLDIKLEVRQ